MRTCAHAKGNGDRDDGDDECGDNQYERAGLAREQDGRHADHRDGSRKPGQAIAANAKTYGSEKYATISAITTKTAHEMYSDGAASGVVSRGDSESRRDCGRGRLRGHNRNDFEVRQVTPICHPLIEQAAIFAFHDLETAAQILGDPASR
jgi:hypothetical protein